MGLPEFWTHFIHGARVARELNIVFQNDEQRLLFNLGTQGPNPLLCTEEKENYVNAGNRLHSQKCGEYLNGISKELFKENRYYVYGLICHHSLDRLTHPYIISRSGKGYRHIEFEKDIDSEMTRRFLDKEPEELCPWDELPVEFPKAIDDAYENLIKLLYSIDGIIFSEGLKDMIEVLKNNNRSSGLNKTFGKLFNLFRTDGTGMEKNKKSTIRDVLNLSKKPWYHPTTGWESRGTFLDLYDLSVSEAKKVIGPSVINNSLPVIPGVSFITNLPCVDY